MDAAQPRLDRRALLPQQWRIEVGLLLECCYVRGKPGSKLQDLKRERIGALAAGVEDWDQVLRLARWFRLNGLLARNLDLWFEAASAKLADEAFEEIDQANEQRRVRFAMLFDEALGLVESFETAGIESLLLKGSAWTHRLYGDGAQRPMSDVDMLVREAQLEEAVDILRERGYTTLDGHSPSVGDSGDRHAPRLVSADSLIEVELHRHIIHPRSSLAFPVTELWNHQRTVKTEKARIPTIGALHEILNVAVSFFLDRHRYYASHGSLMQLVDLRELVLAAGRQGIERPQMIISPELTAIVAASLGCAETLLGPLPDGWSSHDDTGPNGSDRVGHGGSAADQQELGRFLKRRVLDPRSCFFHELVEVDDIGFSHEARSFLRRAWPDRGYLSEKFAAGSSRSLASQRLDQLSELAGVVRRPRRLLDELRTERWMREVESGR